MGNVRIEWNNPDWRRLRRSPALTTEVNNQAIRLQQQANKMAKHKGTGYFAINAKPTEYGQIALVTTGYGNGVDTLQQVRDNMIDQAKHHTLQKAVRAIAKGGA